MITGRGIITGRNQGKTPHDPLTIGSDAEHTLSDQVLSGADTTATQKGHIKLAGELTGTATLPTIASTHSGSAHHAAITLGAGAAELTLSGQQLTLAEVLTPTEHTNIGDGTPHHAAVTVAAPIALSTQALSLINDAAVAVTEIDTGALANLDTVIPTSKAVTTSLAAKLNTTSLVLPFYVAAGTLDTIPLTADQKLPFFDSAAAAKNIALTT